jgi:hypothetical protein
MPSSAATRTLQRGTIYNVILNFDDQLPLDGQDVIAVFENITTQYIFERLNDTLVQTDGWYDMGVEVFYVKQTIPSTALMASTTNSTDTANTTGTMNGRSGWSTANNANVNPLRIRFDVELSFRSAIYEHEYEVYLVSTLNNQAEQERLIVSPCKIRLMPRSIGSMPSKLKWTDSTFSNQIPWCELPTSRAWTTAAATV